MKLKTLIYGLFMRLFDDIADRAADRVFEALDDTDPMPLTHRDAARINRMSKAFDSKPLTERDAERLVKRYPGLTLAEARRVITESKAFDSDSAPDTIRSPQPTHNPRMHSDGVRQDDR